MMYGLSEYATGSSSLPVGSWLLPMWGGMTQNAAQCQALVSYMNSPLFYIGSFLAMVVWILVVVTLIALIRFLWKRAGHY